MSVAAPAKPRVLPAVKQSRVTHRIETITPELAVTLLERNEANRNVDQKTVERYARDMKSGRWHMTGEPIQFGLTGRLLNGQHRLWACVLAQVSFETMVIRGLVNEQQVMDVIDTGKKRTLANAFQIYGEKDSPLLASIVTSCWKFDQGFGGSRTLAITHEEGIEWLRENSEVRQAVLLARQVYARLQVSATAVGTAYYLNGRVDGEAAEEFWQKVGSGADLKSGDAILAFRRWVISALQKREKPVPETWLAYSLKAMNQWRAGKSVRILAVKPDEGMPGLWS